MLSDLISARWYERTIKNYHYYMNNELEWYLHPPFVFILFFENDLIDLTVIEKPDWQSMDSILTMSYDNIEDTTSKDMHTFFDMIIAQLNLYVMTKTSIISNNNTMVIRDDNRCSSISLQQSPTNSLKRTRVYEHDLITGTSSPTITNSTSSHNPVIDLTKMSASKKKVIRPPAAKLQGIINSDTTSSTVNLSSYSSLSKLANSIEDKQHGYFIDVDYYRVTTILLDSGCSYHMARTSTHLQNIMLNDNHDILNLGKITSASGAILSVSGYGTHKLLGKVLLVPSLVCDMTISVGCLDTAGYTLTISNGVAKIIRENGTLVMIGFKHKDNIYTIQRLYPNNFLPVSSTSQVARLPENIFNLTIIPKANNKSPNTPNRASWLYNTFTPRVNPLHSRSSTPDTSSP